MPADSGATKRRLLDEAERLFASRGIHQTSNREILEAAGQRNASALNYHFGSRADLIDTLLRHRNEQLDEERGGLLCSLGSEPTTAQLMTALVRPMVGCFDTQSGRNYLRILAQLSGVFASWDVATDDALPLHLRRALMLIGERPPGISAEIRRERLIAMMLLMVNYLAERARVIERGRELGLDRGELEANLIEMLVGVVEAPAPMASPAGRSGL